MELKRGCSFHSCFNQIVYNFFMARKLCLGELQLSESTSCRSFSRKAREAALGSFFALSTKYNSRVFVYLKNEPCLEELVAFRALRGSKSC